MNSRTPLDLDFYGFKNYVITPKPTDSSVVSGVCLERVVMDEKCHEVSIKLPAGREIKIRRKPEMKDVVESFRAEVQRQKGEIEDCSFDRDHAIAGRDKVVFYNNKLADMIDDLRAKLEEAEKERDELHNGIVAALATRAQFDAEDPETLPHYIGKILDEREGLAALVGELRELAWNSGAWASMEKGGKKTYGEEVDCAISRTPAQSLEALERRAENRGWNF